MNTRKAQFTRKLSRQMAQLPKVSLGYFGHGLLYLTFILSTGCASTPQQFYWGRYESLIFDMYVKPVKATSTEQILALEADLQQAADNNLRVAPGIYAHLGFMYALEGNPGKAEFALREELAAFPESKVLIEDMLKRLGQNVPNQTQHPQLERSIKELTPRQ